MTSSVDGGPLVSVVIPTLNEAERLPDLLGDLRALAVSAEILVVDGGSVDHTVEAARAGGATVVRSASGRGLQLRTGARKARGRWLFFVHADSRLPPPARSALEAFLARAGDESFAHFAFRFRSRGWFERAFEWGQNVREWTTGLVYGDQGLVVSQRLYDAVGGYPDWPLMEDVELVRRLGREGRRVRLDAALLTSSRRYRKEGWWRAWLRNVALITLFKLGRSPERLARWYRPHQPGPRPASERVLLVFVKAPRPGAVKTRLARDIGEAAATRIYTEMGRATVGRVREGPYRTVVCYDPPDAEREVRDWLGTHDLDHLPQVRGDLGARMAAALGRALETAAKACVIGVDVPDLNRFVVAEAFAYLEEAELVIGPATDGGYYLLGLRAPRPELFRDIRWGTDEVLHVTLRRAEALGLEVRLLPELSDVDRVTDVPGAGLVATARRQPPPAVETEPLTTTVIRGLVARL